LTCCPPAILKNLHPDRVGRRTRGRLPNLKLDTDVRLAHSDYQI
jgi:hypothetical protein